MEIRELVKRTKWFYSLYYIVANIFIKGLRYFVKPDPKTILFVSYGGRYYNDSPKVLYDAMLIDNRFSDYKLIWALRNPQKYVNKLPNVITIDTFKYFIIALKARCWITNVQIERGLSFKGKNTFYFHTTHITLPKLSGFHVKSSVVFNTKSDKTYYDCSIAQSDYEAKLQEGMFKLSPEQIIVTGIPKNDILVNASPILRSEIKNRLNINNEKKIILYAPTYREDSPLRMKCMADLQLWQKILGDEYLVLFRVHPTVANETDLSKYKDFVVDVSDYVDNTDLMLIADVLISDYSGIFFEFGVQHKPMYCFSYDYEDYVKNRPLYFDIRNELPCGNLDELHLLEKVKHGMTKEDWAMIDKFREKYMTQRGSATEKCLDIIAKNIQ